MKKNVLLSLLTLSLGLILSAVPAAAVEETGSETTSGAVATATEDSGAVVGEEAAAEFVQDGHAFTEPNSGAHSDLEGDSPLARFSTRSTVDNVQAGETNRPAADFIDVSSHNGNISIADYEKMMTYGIRGVVVKATEGTTYTNPYARTQIANAVAAGMKVSVYHYTHYTTKEVAIAEADYFARVTADLGLLTDVNMVIDIEEGKMKTAAVNENTLAFKQRLNEKGYHGVYYYLSLSWLDASSYNGPFSVSTFGAQNIWVAQYPYSPNASMNWNSGNAAWQWSSTYYVDGISHPFDISTDYTNTFVNTDNLDYVPIYLSYNSKSGEHLYTANRYELLNTVAAGWSNEGIAWDAPLTGQTVYRLYNPNTGEHFYTSDVNEYDSVGAAGWRKEGTAFESDLNQGYPIYRVFNPNAKGAGSHHFTKNSYERDNLVSLGWLDESIAFYGVNK